MIKLKLCDNTRYIIQMLPHFKRGGGKTIFTSPFGRIVTSLFPDSYASHIYTWGAYTEKDNDVVQASSGNLKRDLTLYEIWAESINERFVVCLS